MKRAVYRYLIVETVTDEPLEDALERAVKELWGLRGLAEVEPSVMSTLPQKKLAIVRVRREGLPLLRAALAVYPNTIVRIVKVAGTLRKAERIARSLPPAPGD